MRITVASAMLVLLAALIPAASARGGSQEIVVVRASGSTDVWTATSQRFGYGVVLHNTSTTEDALAVQVHVAVLSRNGAVIGIYLTTVPRLPAGGTFYVGDEPTTIGNTQHAASIIVGVSSSGRQAPRGPLPNGTAHVSGTHIVGTVENVASRTLLTAGTTIFAVYYDRSGKVIGGTRLGHLRFATRPKIAPHKTSSFTAGSGAAVAPARIASVKISVVPTFANAG